MDTSRQRFLKTMNYDIPDRVPYFEEGIRKDVIKAWRKQGLPRNKTHTDIFPTDRFVEIAPDLDPKPPLKHWPTSKKELDHFRNRLDPDHPARLPKTWRRKVSYWQKHDQILMLRVHRGYFLSMGVDNWNRFTESVYLLKDNPEFVREAMGIQGKFAAQLADKILHDIKIDAAIFSEPIGGNEGPLISPNLYRELILPSYQPVLDVLKKHGIEVIIFKTFANARVIIPSIIDFGMNCLWACETNIEAMDYLDLRQTFGKKLRLIGGIDLDALRQDKETIRREVEGNVPQLVADGGYVPLADGRIRSDISFEHYVYYRQLLEKATT